MNRNCPNCGAPSDPYKIKCPYCGTIYFDFAALDCELDKPVFIKFRANQMGQKLIVTALAKPNLETIEYNSESTDCVDSSGTIISRRYVSSSCDMIARFRCLQSEGSLLQIEVEDD